MTTPDTTEVYSFFGTGSSGLQMLNTSNLHTSPPRTSASKTSGGSSYSTVVFHSPSPRPPTVRPGPPVHVAPGLPVIHHHGHPPPNIPNGPHIPPHIPPQPVPTSVVYSITHTVQGPVGGPVRRTTTPTTTTSVPRTTRFAHFPTAPETARPNNKFTGYPETSTPPSKVPGRPNYKFNQEFYDDTTTTALPIDGQGRNCQSCEYAEKALKERQNYEEDEETNTVRSTGGNKPVTEGRVVPWFSFLEPSKTNTTPPTKQRTTRATRRTTQPTKRPSYRRRSTTTARPETTSVVDRRGSVRSIEVTKVRPDTFYRRRNGTVIEADIETTAVLTLNYSLEVTPSPTTTTTIEEEEEDVELAPAFTVFGEPCLDACLTRGYPYSWCTKRRLSKIGTWSDTGHCTVTSNVTSTGDTCIG